MDQNDFQSRVARIVEEKIAQKPVRAKSSRISRGFHNALYPLSVIAAFFVGVLSILIVRHVRFHLLGEIDAQSWTFVGDILIAMGGTWAIMQLLRFNDKVYKAAQTLGVFFAFLTMHNLAFWAPNVMSFLFSPDWVAWQQENAQPNSLYWRGAYFVKPSQVQDQEEDGRGGAYSEKNKNLPRVNRY